jgi:hypothetical protein
MNCLSVTKIGGTSADEDTESGSETHIYRVVYDALGALGRDVVRAVGANGLTMPAFGASLGGLTCQRKTPTQNKENHLEWEVKVEFATPKAGVEKAPEDPDPENGDRWSIDIQIHTVKTEFEKQADMSGSMMVNSSGTPVTGIMKSRTDEEITIGFTTNIILWNCIDACFDEDDCGCVNSEDVTLIVNGEARVFQAGNLKFDDYELTTTVTTGGEQYWKMLLHLRYKFRGWNARVADMGLYMSGPSGLVPIWDDSGQPVQSPQYLNGSGSTLTVGDPVVFLPQYRSTGNGDGFNIIGSADLGTLLLWGLHT